VKFVSKDFMKLIFTFLMLLSYISLNCLDKKIENFVVKESGYEEICKYLLSNQDAINYINDDQATLLILASRYANLQLVEFLLTQEGIELNAKDNLGYTALMWACSIASNCENERHQNNYVKIVRLLLQAGAHLTSDLNNKNLILKVVEGKNPNLEVIQMLLINEVDIFETDKKGMSANLFVISSIRNRNCDHNVQIYDDIVNLFGRYNPNFDALNTEASDDEEEIFD
jgi:ankyrin repeat protein